MAKKKSKPEETFPYAEMMPIEHMEPWSRNPKLHDKETTKASIRRFGFTAPVLLDEDTGKIIAGHGRTEALAEIKAEGAPPPRRVKVDDKGNWCVLTVRGLSFDSEAEAEAYLIADNRIGELGGWDDEMLKPMLEELRQNSEAGLQGVGYKDKDVDALIREQNEDRAEGPKPEEQLQDYLDSAIRQVVLFFDGKEYDGIIEKLDEAQEILGVDTYTDVVKVLLDKLNKGKIKGYETKPKKNGKSKKDAVSGDQETG